MMATQAGDGRPGRQTSRGDRVGRGDAGTGVASLSTLGRLAFLGGPMLSMIDSWARRLEPAPGSGPAA
jgi:hypothetical protein